MIFFVIDGKRSIEENFKNIETAVDQREGFKSYTEPKLISWNEVKAYKTLDKLKKAVFDVAKTDFVCKNMCETALEEYGIDLFNRSSDHLSTETINKIINKTFFYWAHPMIGNIINSPEVRPECFTNQYIKNWDKIPVECVGEETKAKIVELDNTLGQLKTSSRDQVRICYNITELARAIIGEITTVSSKRIEKIFALELCLNTTFKESLQGIVFQLIKKIDSTLKVNFTKKGLIQTEYLKYYFPNTKQMVNNSSKADKYAAQWYLYQHLIVIALEDEEKHEKYQIDKYTLSKEHKKVFEDSLETWRKLPISIRCTILINSFRRFSLMDVRSKRHIHRYSMQCISDEKDVGFKGPYSPRPSAGNNHVPKLSMNTGKWLAWSWNRDEYHKATTTYRTYLMPLWAGSSGHGTGTVNFIVEQLGSEVSEMMPIIVLNGLFSFWRLYYDKRISGVHTLAETLEGSISSVGKSSLEWENVSFTFDMPQKIQTDDVTEILNNVQEKVGENYFIDPIKLMWQLKANYYTYEKNKVTHEEAFINLETSIDSLRKKMTEKNYQVPRWSKELSGKSGFDVTSFSASLTSQTNSLSRVSLQSIQAT